MESTGKIKLAKAVIAAMKAIKGVDKSMTVGSGTSTYKGVSDKDVKNIIGEAMENAGLCLLPISIEAKTQIDRWEETNQYGTKQKQSVLSEVTTKYLLLHESGESIELAGYGHGTDPQDKAAGKATTYAMKYTLLYTFMVATGQIDDADKEHSESKEVPKSVDQSTQENVNRMRGVQSGITDAHRKAIAMAATIPAVNSILKDPACAYLLTNEEFKQLITKRREELAA